MIRRPPRSTQGVSSAASDVYKRQQLHQGACRFPEGLSPASHIQTFTRYQLPTRTRIPQNTSATTRDSLSLHLNSSTRSHSGLLAIVTGPNVLRPRHCGCRAQNRRIVEHLWPHHPRGRYRTRAPQNQLVHQRLNICEAIAHYTPNGLAAVNNSTLSNKRHNPKIDSFRWIS